MNPGRWQWLKQLSGLLAVERVKTVQQEQSIVAIHRNILLPIRLLMVVSVFYYYFSTPWIVEAVTTAGVVFEAMQNIFAGYSLAAIAIAVVFYVVRRFPSLFWMYWHARPKALGTSFVTHNSNSSE